MASPDFNSAETLLQHFDWTRRLARALVSEPDRADDLTQETWLSFLRSPPEPGRPVRPWLSRVMHNAVRERARREQARADHEAHAARGTSVTSDSDLAQSMELHRKLVEHVMDLEPLYRRVLLLRFFEGLSTAEIARQDDVPQATVRTRLRRGLESLRERLERKDSGDWRLALLPLLPKVGLSAPTGVMIVGTKSMLALVAGLAALFLGIVWWGGGDGSPDLSAPAEGGGQAVLDEPATSGSATAAITPLSTEVEDSQREEVAAPAPVGRMRRVRVVRDEDGVPLPGAEVGFVSHEMYLEWREERALSGEYNALPCIQALSESHIADEAGEVMLPIANEVSWVSGSLGDYFAVQRLPAGDEAADLRLPLAPPLRALVVDPAGNPVSGASVGLFEYRPDDPSGSLLRVSLTDPSGVATLHRARKRSSEGSHHRVGLNFPLAGPVEVDVDPRRPPAEPIRLVAPATGSVRVVLVGDEEEPWPESVDLSLYAIVPSKTDRGRMIRSDQRDYRHLVGRREMVFEHVAVGIELHLFVYGEGLRKDAAVNHSGPRAAGEQVVITVPFTERYAWIEGRFALHDGGEVPTGLSVWSQNLDNDIRRIDRGMTVAADGSFRIALGERAPAGARCRLTIQTDSQRPPSLSAAFEAIAPAPGSGTDAGQVLLGEAPLIAGGTVIDQDGNPIEYADLSLGDQLWQPDGTFNWNPMGFEGARTDAEGRFELRGELLQNTYALYARARDHEIKWVPFEFRQSDLVIVLADRGGLGGQLRLPAGFPVERLAVVAAPQEGAPPDWSLNTIPRVGVRTEGAFEFPDLNPGTYRIAVQTGMYSEPLADLGTFEVSAGDQGSPEALADVDLKSLKVIDIEIVSPDAGEVQGVVRVGESHRQTLIQDGAVSLVTPLAGLDVTVLAYGYRPVHIPDLRRSTRVDLEPGIPVVVSLPEGFTLPEAPVYLEVALIPQDPPSGRDAYMAYTRDSVERTFMRTHDLHPTRRFDGGREVTLGAAAAGDYELSWRVVRPGEAGMSGGHIRPVRWKERQETFRVEELGLRLPTQPVQEQYERAVKEAEENH